MIGTSIVCFKVLRLRGEHCCAVSAGETKVCNLKAQITVMSAQGSSAATCSAIMYCRRQFMHNDVHKTSCLCLLVCVNEWFIPPVLWLLQLLCNHCNHVTFGCDVTALPLVGGAALQAIKCEVN